MKSELTNREVAEALEKHGKLLEIAGESSFRTRAYLRAAAAIRNHAPPLAAAESREELLAIPGVGAGIAAAIEELFSSDTLASHEELRRKYPESLIDLISIPGVGAKTALKLFTLLQVDGLDALDEALSSGAISRTKGLGVRFEATIREGLASLRRRTGRTPLGVALPMARDFIATFSLSRPQDTVSLAGSARRWDVAVGDLNLVFASMDVLATMGSIANSELVETFDRTGDSSANLLFTNGMRATVLVVDPRAWGSTLISATGDAEHLAGLGPIPEWVATEQEVYAARGLPWIPPELRNGSEAFSRWADIPSLVRLEDIHGEFHAHTTWSDGVASIEAMAQAAALRGYDYLGITDHSHGLGIAGGLDLTRLAAQRVELQTLDGSGGIKLLAGAEVEVHRDGSLDYDDRALSDLDVVVASLHSGLRQPREQLTSRLIAVLENENVDIVAHPSGRLIERREGGNFDWDQVFAVAARTGTALEINADPARLDLDPALARRASDAGCLITVNCDAHSPGGFSVMEYGVAMARRAWLRPEQILNCWPRPRVLAWLAARGRQAS